MGRLIELIWAFCQEKEKKIGWYCGPFSFVCLSFSGGAFFIVACKLLL